MTNIIHIYKNNIIYTTFFVNEYNNYHVLCAQGVNLSVLTFDVVVFICV